ncbi:SET domain-containing protein-lysine N-methyltransferase [Clostridium akagii]|uniref:SET domain-containing protein-lysine N-methyltransferase n=1 Tax=Clostridium akagii TaxID=91623 RepID=UPI00068EBB43|nr:SET domain-containing protein [Clostridium akagii]
MLFVKTFLGKSCEGGIGLFAGEQIKEGKVLWKFSDLTTKVWSTKDYENLKSSIPAVSFDSISKYIYMHRSTGLYYLNLDDTRFMSHSINATVVHRMETWLDVRYAARDIAFGEELIVYYNEIYDVDTFEDYLKKHNCEQC